MKQFFPILILSCAYSITYPIMSLAEEASAAPAVVVDDNGVEEDAKLATELKSLEDFDVTLSDEPVESIGTVWTGNAELGLVAATGNTENQSINFGFNVARETDNWKQSIQAKALRAEDKGAKTAENLLLELQVDRKLAQYDYLFGDFSYEEDEFAGFDNQMMASVGYGRKILDSDEWKLRA